MRRSSHTRHALAALALLVTAPAVSSCIDVERTVFLSSGERTCFLAARDVCVQLENVETEGNCNFSVYTDLGGATPVASFTRVNERARVPVTVNERRYEIEVIDTYERVLHSDEGTFGLRGPL